MFITEPCQKCGKRFPTEITKSATATKNPPLSTVFLYTVECTRHKNGCGNKIYIEVETDNVNAAIEKYNARSNAS